MARPKPKRPPEPPSQYMIDRIMSDHSRGMLIGQIAVTRKLLEAQVYDALNIGLEQQRRAREAA